MTVREYPVRRAACALPRLSGRLFDPGEEPFCRGRWAPIDRYAWGGDYRPEARAWLAWSEDGLKALLCAREARISARVTDFGGPVWTDSCLEFFFRPFEEDARYMNIEVNAAGAALIAVGAGREGRIPLAERPGGMDLQASGHEGGWWAVAYTVPFGLIEAAFGRALAPKGAFWGNFYCCDESVHPHFGSWSPIRAPQPDFHRPECFGRLLFAPD